MSVSKNRVAGLLLLTFSVATCSIIYELLLAQILATLYGNTIVRYTFTIGLFLFSLGMGALWESLRPAKNILTKLVYVEITLAFCGFFIPGYMVAINYFNFKLLGSHASNWFEIGFYTSHIWIFIIGFLSGFEIPLLYKLAQSYNRKLAINVLSVDFIGTFAGTILFPLCLYPIYGLTQTSAIIGLVNIIVAILLVSQLSGRKILPAALCGGVGVFILFSFIYEESITLTISNIISHQYKLF